MKKIEMSKGVVLLVDDEDYERVNQFRWNVLTVGKNIKMKYGIRNTQPGKVHKRQLVHRFILGVNGVGITIDHIDHNGLNNQKSNLRICTRSQNGQNQRSKSTSLSVYKGFYFDKIRKKYIAGIQVEGKNKYLGYYDKEIDAALAYDRGAIKYFGEFACLNFPENHSK